MKTPADIDFGEKRIAGPLLKACGAVFLLAMATRVGFYVASGPDHEPDSGQYLLLARNLALHGTFAFSTAPPLEPAVRRAPVYPLFLATFEFLGLGTERAPFFVQHVLDASVAVLILLLASLVVPFPWAVAAAFVYAIHPGAIAFSNTMLTETLFTFLFTWAVGALALGLQRNALGWTIASGLGLGVAALCRPIALVFPLLFAVALPLVARPARPARPRVHLAVLCGCVALAIMPWCVRSSLAAGTFVLVQTAGRENVLSATDRRGLSGSMKKVDPSYSNAKRKEDLDFVALGWQAIARDPLAYVALRARTVPFLFLTSFDSFTGIDRSYQTLWNESRPDLIALKLGLLIAFSLVPFVLAVAGTARLRGDVTATLLASVWVGTILVHLPLWIEYRFWVPAIPAQLVSAATGAHVLWARLSAPRRL
jgi:4-amino-4-deoxy-L-arabinose transferase-like glycosyltransferase